METTAESDYDIDDLRTRVLDYLRSEPQSQRLDDSPRLSLSDHEESVLRDVLSRHEAMLHLGYTNGRLHTAIVRALMRVRDPMHFAIEENGAPATAIFSLVNILAFGSRALPRFVFPGIARWKTRLMPGPAAPERIRASIYAEGLSPAPLLDVVSDVPQLPGSAGFTLDASRNIVTGIVVGADLVRSGDRFAVVEANTSIGQEEHWLLYKDENPFIDNMARFASSTGYRRLVVVNNDRGLRGRQEWHYREAAKRNGLDIDIVEPNSVPATKHVRSTMIPEIREPDTLCVRIRNLPTWIDHLIGDKECLQNLLLDAFAGTDGPVFVPDTEPGWLDRVDWESGAAPNLVSKISDADKGLGITFYKARSKAHATELLSAGHGPHSTGLFAGLSRSIKSGEKVLQPFVRTGPLQDDRLGKYRVIMLITPVGSCLLAVTKMIAGESPPKDLPYGIVENPAPFLVNGGFGGIRVVPTAEDVAALLPVAESLSKALTDRLLRTFNTNVEVDRT